MSGPARQRKPGGFHLRRRRPRRDENFIWTYQFPEHVEACCRRDRPEITDREWKLIEQGLREWFLCCAWRDGEVLGMPSRLVDEAWHEFILDSLAYTGFCERAFGEYLHHTPETSMTTPLSGALDATTRAWDRSGTGGSGGVLWGLDVLLGLPQAFDRAVGGGDGGGHHHHSGGETGSSSEAGASSEGVEVGGGDFGGGGDSGGGGCGGGDSGGGGCGGGGGE